MRRKDECTLGRNLGWVHKVTLSLKKIVHRGSAIRAAISPTRLAEVMAIRKTVFMAKCNKEAIAIDSKGSLVRAFNTKCGSHGCIGGLISG